MRKETFALNQSDFEGTGRSLNFSGFTNLEKAVAPTKEDSLEKGVMSDIGNNYDGKNMVFSKTGKEIKEKIQSLLPSITAKEMECRAEMTACLEKIGFMPTSPLDSWETRDASAELMNYKKFYWEQCHWDERNNGGSAFLSPTPDGISEKSKTACSKEEAEYCRKYNQKLEGLIDCICDRLKAETLIRNLEETNKYDLKLTELTSLGF